MTYDTSFTTMDQYKSEAGWINCTPACEDYGTKFYMSMTVECE